MSTDPEPQSTRRFCSRCDRDVDAREELTGSERLLYCQCGKRVGSLGIVKDLASVGNPAAEVVRYRRVRTV
jgi:DNA-directed RNA polymerase subunit RPC12/RpoP